MPGKNQRIVAKGWKRPILCFIIILLAGCLISGCTNLASSQGVKDLPTESSAEIHFIDSSNNTISLEKPVKRIVALQRDTIEVLIVMGSGDTVVGVPDYVAGDPHFMRHLPNAVDVGASGSPDIELISTLKPNLVILMKNSPENIKTQMKNLNLTVATFECYILQDVPSSVKTLGIVTGNEKNATQYLNFFEKYNATVSDRISNISYSEESLVYFELSNSFVAAGSGSGGDSLIKNIKGINLGQDLPTPWPQVSKEWVVQSNPDIILKMTERHTEKLNNFNELYDELVNRPDLSDVNAIKNSRVSVVSGNIMYGPRGIIGQLYLGKVIWPERFADVDPDAVLQEYANTFLPNADDIDTIYPPLHKGNSSSVNTISMHSMG
jgi:iron complex transport system substrate-binding protein